MVKYEFKDILDSTDDIIIQQVNCQNVMGSGLAKQIYTKWPVVKRHYHEYCYAVGSPYDLLGKVQYVSIDEGRYVANIFGQLNYGRCKGICYTSYEHLEVGLKSISERFPQKSFAIPYGIGCGLANGDWGIVEDLINIYFGGLRATIYKKI